MRSVTAISVAAISAAAISAPIILVTVVSALSGSVLSISVAVVFVAIIFALGVSAAVVFVAIISALIAPVCSVISLRFTFFSVLIAIFIAPRFRGFFFKIADPALVMLGILIIALCGDPVASRSGILGKVEVFFENLSNVATNLYIGPITVKDLIAGKSPTTFSGPIIASS